MHEVIIYCSESIKEAMGYMPGCAVMANRAPKMPANKTDILVVEDDYEAENGMVNALRELFRFRQHGWIGAFVLVNKQHTPPPGKLWTAACKDPLVRYLGLISLITEYKSVAAFTRMWNDRNYLNADLEELYEDYRESIYGYKNYLDELRHELRSKLNLLRPTEVDKCIDLCRIAWEETLRYLRREHAHREFQSLQQRLWGSIENAENTELVAQAVNDVYEKLIGLLDITEDSNVVPNKPVSLVYVCNNFVEFKQLEKCLMLGAKGAAVQILPAYGLKEASRVLDVNKQVTGIISNYRFRDENDVFRLYNGAIVLRTLNDRHGPFNLAYLTRNRRFARQVIARKTNEEVFDKERLIDKASAEELHRFLRFTYRGQHGTVNEEDYWPSTASTTSENKSLKVIREVHDRQYLTADRRHALREDINSGAETILTKLLGGNQEDAKIPPVSKILGKRDQLTYLCRILKLRRVVIGLCNTPGLNDRFPNLSNSNGNEQRERMEIVFSLLSSMPSARPTLKTDQRQIDKKISEYFSFLGMSVINDYTYGSEQLSDFTTQEERDWLRAYRKEQH